MPRKPRQELEDGIHHVWARGNNREGVYFDDDDRALYLLLLGRVVVKMGWHCLSFCLMDNHLHLLVQTPETNLGKGMQRLHGVYAQSFNERHGRVGHVFQGRYGNELVQDDEQFWTVARYIVRNPVEAGLCRMAEEWKWSSHRGVIEGTAPEWVDRGRLLERFATMGGEPVRVYREAVDG
jgi:REP element-mobilizing transposase RayT